MDLYEFFIAFLFISCIMMFFGGPISYIILFDNLSKNSRSCNEMKTIKSTSDFYGGIFIMIGLMFLLFMLYSFYLNYKTYTKIKIAIIFTSMLFIIFGSVIVNKGYIAVDILDCT